MHGEAKAVLATERAGIAEAVAEGTRALQRLHVIVTNTFARHPVQLTEWKRVRRVTRKPKTSGTSKASAKPEAAVPVAGTGAPPASDAPPALGADEPLKRAS